LQAVENTQNSEIAGPAATLTISPEDHLRAQIYQLLARLLSQSPDKSSLQTYASLKGDAGEFGDAINNFATIAGRISQEAADTEFHDLFVGLTRGELLPFGSCAHRFTNYWHDYYPNLQTNPASRPTHH